MIQFSLKSVLIWKSYSKKTKGSRFYGTRCRVMGLSYSEDPMIVAGVVLTQCQRVTDRQTDGQTDGRTYDS